MRLRWSSAFILLVVSACRKPAPDEVVFTGQEPPRSGSGLGGSPNLPTTGGNSSTGGSDSTGGTTSTGGNPTGGTGGTGGNTEPQITCGTTPGKGTAFSKQALLGSIADCAIGRYARFQAQAKHLEEAAKKHAASLTPETAKGARNAWRSAIAAWQQAELFRFGPAARSTQPAGQDIRDQIYSWPLVSRCKIDEQLVSGVYGEAAFASTPINARGLSAFEYLAFHTGTDNGCTQFSSINADGTWAALSEAELSKRKAEYAAAVASDVLDRATKLVKRWDPAGGNFCSELTNAGSTSTSYETPQAALNAVSDALFYIDKEIKDWKLGNPVGYGDCLETSCPESVESLYAGASVDHLRANLEGFRALFQGCGENASGLGFDDWLTQVGGGELAAQMTEDLDHAESAVDAIDVNLELAVVSEPAKVQAAYEAVKLITDELKTQFVTLLNLELPKTVEGDND